MTKFHKPMLCLDFDGVLHSYTSGWEQPFIIIDDPVPDAITFLERATKDLRVAIYSARSCQPGGIEAMKTWLRIEMQKHFNEVPDWFNLIEWPTEKPPARVSLDDRAITFTGTFPPIGELIDFKPWNKK